jgi:sugar transferase (PEP-CTERM/EpsH1 system associated)
MNILFIVPYVPSWIFVRPYSLIRALTGLGHRVTVLTLASSPADQAAVEALRKDCHAVIALPLPTWRSLVNAALAVPGPDPLQAHYCWHPGLARQIDALLAPADGRPAFDVVHVEHLRGVRYGLYIRSQSTAAHPGLPVIWDSVDSISHLFRQASRQSKRLFSRLITAIDVARTERYEGWLPSQFDRVLVTSPIDQQAFQALLPAGSPAAQITILPNGTDLDYFQPAPAADRDPDALVISGKMSYHANVTMTLYMAQEIMPLIWQRRPNARLWIVGKDPTREITALAANPKITVTGTVDDLRPYLQRAAVAVAPIQYGAGIQNKVLQAMACATPVVCTGQAVKALLTVAGRNLLVADDPGAFAESVIDLLEHPEKRQQIGEAGLQYVRQHHDWSQIAARLVDYYTEAIASRSSSRAPAQTAAGLMVQ